MEADQYTRAEAEFALWDMNVREKNLDVAAEIAQKLARQFPENPEVARFLAARPAAKQTK
jgi:ParB-like chromosome segregation protein Spo0J